MATLGEREVPDATVAVDFDPVAECWRTKDPAPPTVAGAPQSALLRDPSGPQSPLGPDALIARAEQQPWAGATLVATTAMVAIPLGLWSLLLLGLPYSATLAVALKIALWGLPALAYPRLERANPAAFLGFDRAPHVRWLFGAAVFIAGYSLLIHGGRPSLPPISAFFLVSAVVVSPIVEEAAFRGVLLRRLDSVAGASAANLVTAALFVVYHLPLWLARGSDISVMGCLWVAGFSVCMGYAFQKTGSLWTCIGIHALNNLMLGS